MTRFPRFLVLLLALVACPLFAQERRTAPLVPAEMLDGQRLVDKVSRFSIQAPEGWTWLQVASGDSQYRNYAASNPNGLGYAVNVVETDLAWTAANAEDMQIGMAEKLRSEGFGVTLVSFRGFDVPAQASYRFTWRVVLPNGVAMHRFGYELKHGSRVLSFTCFSDNETEPNAFIAFVRSLRLL